MYQTPHHLSFTVERQRPSSMLMASTASPREEAKAVAQAVKAAGGKQVHCLAWDFEMDIRQAIAGIETELDVKIRLHRIPREIMEKNRTEVPPFFEVALLEAEPVIRKGPKGKTVEIKLKNFLPSLTEVPSQGA